MRVSYALVAVAAEVILEAEGVLQRVAQVEEGAALPLGALGARVGVGRLQLREEVLLVVAELPAQAVVKVRAPLRHHQLQLRQQRALLAARRLREGQHRRRRRRVRRRHGRRRHRHRHCHRLRCCLRCLAPARRGRRCSRLRGLGGTEGARADGADGGAGLLQRDEHIARRAEAEHEAVRVPLVPAGGVRGGVVDRAIVVVVVVIEAKVRLAVCKDGQSVRE